MAHHTIESNKGKEQSKSKDKGRIKRDAGKNVAEKKEAGAEGGFGKGRLGLGGINEASNRKTDGGKKQSEDRKNRM